jgi:hypothetical protein
VVEREIPGRLSHWAYIIIIIIIIIIHNMEIINKDINHVVPRGYSDLLVLQQLPKLVTIIKSPDLLLLPPEKKSAR